MEKSEQVIDNEKVLVLRPSKMTNTKSLASAMARELEKHDKIIAQAIGVSAVNQTVKGICIAGGFLGQQGKSINVRLGFHDVEVSDRPGELITAIRFTLSKV